MLISDARNLRLHDLSEHPRSVGFPPGHPPMNTFLGVPILLRGVAYGNLYLTEKDGGGDFTDEDEELVSLLAAQAAVAVENARLYESATSWSHQLESLNEIGGALVGELELEPLLDLIATRLRELIGARLVAIALPAGEGLRIAAADGEGASDLAAVSHLEFDSKTGRVLERGRSERIDSLLEDPEVNQDVARRLGASTGLYVPLLARERPIGVLVAHDKMGPDPRFTSADLRLAEQFANRASIAVDLSRQVARDALRRVVAGQELERRRLARELHDETGQALTSILLGLVPWKRQRAPTSSDRQRATSASWLSRHSRTCAGWRCSSGRRRSMTSVSQRRSSGWPRRSPRQTGMHVELEAQLGEARLPAEVETTLYRIVQEALTNIVKHAEAHRCSILLVRKATTATVVIEDDGRGFDTDDVRAEGLGLAGMRERVELHDGRLTVESTPTSGTTLVAEVPL